MNNMIFVTSFNNHLKEFIEKLTLIFPEYEIINDYVSGFHLPLIFDKELYIKKFNDGISIENFDNHILNRNEDLFLKYNFSFIDIFNDISDNINKIKNLWKKLNDNYKNIIWQYLKVLVVLRNRHYNKNINNK